MKLNWAERWAVNNPLRVLEQRLEARWFKARAGLTPGLSFLEIGCGRGAGAAVLLEAFQPRRLYALDLDPAMIRKAEAYLKPAERRRVELLVADSERLPLADGSVDAVFGFGVLHHLPRWRDAVEEIRRVLRPGGKYLLEELYPSLYQNALTRHVLLHPAADRFRSADLRDALAQFGLPVRVACELPGVGILAVCERNEVLPSGPHGTRKDS